MKRSSHVMGREVNRPVSEAFQSRRSMLPSTGGVFRCRWHRIIVCAPRVLLGCEMVHAGTCAWMCCCCVFVCGGTSLFVLHPLPQVALATETYIFPENARHHPTAVYTPPGHLFTLWYGTAFPRAFTHRYGNRKRTKNDSSSSGSQVCVAEL